MAVIHFAATLPVVSATAVPGLSLRRTSLGWEDLVLSTGRIQTITLAAGDRNTEAYRGFNLMGGKSPIAILTPAATFTASVMTFQGGDTVAYDPSAQSWNLVLRDVKGITGTTYGFTIVPGAIHLVDETKFKGLKFAHMAFATAMTAPTTISMLFRDALA